MTDIDSVARVVAGKLLWVARPIEFAQRRLVRSRPSRGGDRQFNYALHVVAVTRARMRSSTDRIYYKDTHCLTHHPAGDSAALIAR